jgi:nicotinate-nucleotide adenylyltransferase
MMPKKSNKIALFGGSFNPPHLGHLAVLRELAKNPDFDEIWVVPVCHHAFAKDLADFDVRLELLRLLIDEVGSKKLKISTVERDLGKTPNTTFDTVTHLKKQHPHSDFVIVMGSDAKKDLPRWHRYEELKRLADFHFVTRKGYEESDMPEVSSSQIRERLKKGEDITKLTTRKIQDYLSKNRVFSS